MKEYKPMSILSLMLAIALCLMGCRIPGEQYTFTQSLDQIVSVSICRYDYTSKSIVPIKSLSEDDWQLLAEDISSLGVRRHFGDHTSDYGEVVVYISYKNSEAEVIGIWNVATVDSQGRWYIGYHYFESETFTKMLLKYIDIELVPELNQYLTTTN